MLATASPTLLSSVGKKPTSQAGILKSPPPAVDTVTFQYARKSVLEVVLGRIQLLPFMRLAEHLTFRSAPGAIKCIPGPKKLDVLHLGIAGIRGPMPTGLRPCMTYIPPAPSNPRDPKHCPTQVRLHQTRGGTPTGEAYAQKRIRLQQQYCSMLP